MARARRVVICDFAEPTREAQAGVRAYVALRDLGSDRLDVLVRSPSGRWLRTWAPISGFQRFRVKALRPEHPLYHDERVCDRDPERLATELAAAAHHARQSQTSP
jgi:hypothetical protein